MRAREFTSSPVMAKIERTGQIVQILRHEDQVRFSDDRGWFLVNTEPGRRTGTGVKWIPDSTRFSWVKNFESLKESPARIPPAIEEFLDSLNPDDCGVEEIGAYRIHFEGFTSDCKSSADYRRDPEAVYQQVYRDFIQREGGARPLVQDMAGDEDYPILFSIFRRRKKIAESTTATARQVLAYINQTHHEPFRPGEKMHAAVLAHPQWELKKVPLLNLNIPDQEYDDVDYDDEELEADPYGRVMMVEPEHAGQVSQHLIDKNPIVIDADRYIIDGNHRAWAAKYLLNRDYIQAWVPVTQNVSEAFDQPYPMTWEKSEADDSMDALARLPDGSNLSIMFNQDLDDEGEGIYSVEFWRGNSQEVTGAGDSQRVFATVLAAIAEFIKKRKPEQLYFSANKDVEPGQKADTRANLYTSLVRRYAHALGYEADVSDFAGSTTYKLYRLDEQIQEVNYPDELTVSDQIQNYFYRRGYDLAGEGRDQMAFESPRGTIVKVLGTGEDEREQIVRNYVKFFEQNQQNPFYPRIYSSGEFAVDGETYFVYEMERVNYVANEEATLDYIEKLMSAVDRGQGAEFVKKNPVPDEIGAKQLSGLLAATEQMMRALGGQAPLDLSAVENLGRRDNGHLVIVDPYSL